MRLWQRFFVAVVGLGGRATRVQLYQVGVFVYCDRKTIGAQDDVRER